MRSRWQTKHMVDFHEDNFGFYYLFGYGSKTPTLLTHRHHSVLTQLAMLLQRVVCLSCNRVPGRGRRRPIAKRDSDETFLQGAELGEHLLVSQTSERLPVQGNDLITWTTHGKREREREMFYLMMHSTHFIYGYMALDIWLRTILIVRKETRCCHIGYSYKQGFFYMHHPTDRITYHSLCYTSCGALAGTHGKNL